MSIYSIHQFVSFFSFEGEVSHNNQIPLLFDGIMDKVLNRETENQNLSQNPYEWA